MRLTIAAALLAAALPAEEARPLPEGASLDIVVQEVQGEVDLQRSAREMPVAATKGMKVPVGAKVYTGVESAILLSFGTNSTALLAPCSICELKAFEMKGDQLVARIHIEPGVADVKLKQLAAFHTDFQVSTPRMTCSVRGSGANVGSECDEIEDHATCTEHEAHASDSTGKEHTLTEKEQTNQQGDSNADIATQENVAGTTPTGTTEQETENPDLLAQNQGSIDSTTSDATVNTSSSPSGGDTSGGTTEPPPPTDNLTQTEEDLLHMTLADLDVLEHIRRDPETGFEGGIDSDSTQHDMSLYASQNGFMPFVTDKLKPFLLEQFEDVMVANPGVDPAREADFYDDGSGLSFDNLEGTLSQADQEAHSPVTRDSLATILENLFHVEWHIVAYTLQPGDDQEVYDFEHSGFHSEVLGDLEALHAAGDYDMFLARYIEGGIESWLDRNGLDEDPEPGEPEYAPYRHVAETLLEIAKRFRLADGEGGVAWRSDREHDAGHVLYDLQDLREHIDTDDPDDFQPVHDDMEIGHRAVDVVGLAASASVLELTGTREGIEEEIEATFASDPVTRDLRLNDLHDPAKFGTDAYPSDWHDVQDGARANSLSPTTLASAILDEVHLDWHDYGSTLLPGQYGSEHAELHDRLDALFGEAGSDFEQFKTDLLDDLHNAWHQETSVPVGVSEGQPGYPAHQHFHGMLDKFHDDADAAVGE